MRFILIILVLIALTAPTTPCSAKIYKYQRDGVWYYTDTPPPDMPSTTEEVVESARPAPPSTPGGALLLKDYPARNAIEKAAVATVAIKTPIGYGSGFFISTNGYILTNKHVIRTPEQQSHRIDAYFDQVDNRAEEIEEKFHAEQRRLDSYKIKLERLEQLAKDENDPSRKKSYADEYQFRKQEYDDWYAGFQQRKQKFASQLKQYQSGREDYAYRRSVADLSHSFTVILVDDTELYAHLVAISANHDLALLKIDGYQTPALKPAVSHLLAQGDPVYAIGNPAMLRNTVTSGIFSGYEGDFIQTNAQISPGNSGGPLIDADGQVLGINTKKKIGSAFEGLGFAIPIQTALDDFRSYLP
jgi:serine protease Do